MIVCINCLTDTKSKMDRLLLRNHYRDYSELVAVAVDNLWLMEQEVAEKGALIIDSATHSGTTSVASELVEASQSVVRSAKGIPFQNRPNAAAPAAFRIPELFLAAGLDGLTVTTIEMPASESSEEVFTLDRWLFGQYNKLLPVKANCRALLRIAAEHPEGVSLEEVAPRIGEAAALLGDYLADHDRRHQTGRDDLLATAFPRSGPDAEKSRARYANQFVGCVNSQGVLSGMLSDYRMAALAPGEGARLLPTQSALQLARLANPVLDGGQTDPAQKFSPEETTFLLDHIRAHVPVEAFAFRTLIHEIADGAVTPDKLDEALRVHIPVETNRSLSPSFLTSQRSGALSRMADLGLIARERKGVRVSYTITPQGEAFVQEGNPRKKKENACS